MEFLLVTFGIFISILLIQVILIVNNLLGCEVRIPYERIASENELPAYIKAFLDECAAELKDLNFTFSHYSYVEDIIVTPNSKLIIAVYLNSETKTYATVKIPDLPDKSNPYVSEFVNCFSDCTQIVTVNGIRHFIIGEVPDMVINDAFALNIKEQFSFHLNKLNSFSSVKEIVLPEPEEYTNIANRIYNHYFDSLQNTGWIVCTSNNKYHLSLKGAIKEAVKVFKGQNKYSSLQKQKALRSDDSIKVPTEIIIDNYEKFTVSTESVKTNKSKAVLFIITAVLFLISFGYTTSFSFVFSILVIVFIHEMGHFLGMKLFGFKDVKMFYIPFIGAVTTGRQMYAIDPNKKAIIYLLGPVPGIILSFTLLIINSFILSPFILSVTMLALAINYINLLPLMPLDGGRLFNLLFFQRYPSLAKYFIIISGLIFVAAGLFAHMYTLLIISLFLFISLSSANIKTEIMKRVIKVKKLSGANWNRSVLLTVAFDYLRDIKLPAIKKFRLLKSIEEEQTSEVPTISTIVGFLIIYIILFAMPILFFILLPLLKFFPITNFAH